MWHPPHSNFCHSVERKTSPNVFDKTSKSVGTSSFIEWDDLIDARKGYVKNDAMDLDIIIEVANPYEPTKSALICENNHKSCKDDCVAKFDLTITNVSSLMAVRSPNSAMQKKTWNINVYKHEGHLAVRLDMITFELHNQMMLVKLTTKGDAKSIVQARRICTKYFTTWDELLKPENGSISNNSIKLEVTFVSETTFQNTKNVHQTITSGISVPRFCIEVPGISGLNSISTPEVTIRGVPWKAQVCKQFVTKMVTNSLFALHQA